MDSNKYVNFTPVVNAVKERLEDDSLIHTFSSKTRTLKSTKLFNAKLSKSAKTKRNYQNFLKWKNEALKETEENVEVTEDSEFSDGDYKKCHNEANPSSLESKIHKKKRVVKKSAKKKKPPDVVSWLPNSDSDKSKSDKDSELQIEENVKNVATRSTKTKKGRNNPWKGPFERTLIHLKIGSPNEIQCTPTNVTIDDIQEDNTVSEINDEGSSPVDSPIKESSKLKNVKGVSKKCPRDVRKNLTIHLNDVDAGLSSSFEDVNNDFIPSDFKAQSTQILSDTLLTGAAEGKKKASRPTLNEVLNQPRDSGIEEDSKEENVKYQNGIRSTDKIQSKPPGSADKSAKEVPNLLAHDVALVPSTSKDLIGKKSQSTHEKCSLKIIGEERLTKKYKIISNKQTEVQSTVQNKFPSDSNSNNRNENRCELNEIKSNSNDFEVDIGDNPDDYNNSEADSENGESHPVPQTPSFKDNKNVESKAGKSQYVSRQMKKLKEMRLIEENCCNSNHRNEEFNNNEIKNRDSPSASRKLSLRKKVHLEKNSKNSSSDDDGSQCNNQTRSNKTPSARGRRKINTKKSNTRIIESSSSLSKNLSSTSDSDGPNNLNKKNKNCQNVENQKKDSITGTDGEELNNTSYEEDKITNDTRLSQLKYCNITNRRKLREQNSQETEDDPNLNREPTSRKSSVNSQQSADSSPSVTLHRQRKISEIDSALKVDENSHQPHEGIRTNCDGFENGISSGTKTQSEDEVPHLEEHFETKFHVNEQQNRFDQNYPNHEDGASKDNDEEENISSVTIQKLSQLKKMDLFGNNDSDSASDDEKPTRKSNIIQIDSVIEKVEESNSQNIGSIHVSEPDTDDESIQSSPLKYESSSESSSIDRKMNDIAPDEIEEPNNTQERDDQAKNISDDDEDEYKDAEEDNEASFQSFSSSDNEKVHQSHGLIDQKSTLGDAVEENCENPSKRELSKDIESDLNNSSDDRSDNNSDIVNNSCVNESQVFDSFHDSQEMIDDAEGLSKKIHETSEVDEDEMKPSAFKKLSQFKKMDLFGSTSDSSSGDEKVGKMANNTNSVVKESNSEISDGNIREKVKKKKRKKKKSEVSNESKLSDAVKNEVFSKDSCTSYHSSKMASRPENDSKNENISEILKQGSDSELSVREEILDNDLDDNSENKEDANGDNCQNVIKKRSKKSKKIAATPDEIQASLTGEDEAVNDEEHNSSTDRNKRVKKKKKSSPEISDMRGEQEFHEPFLEKKRKFRETPEVIVPPAKQIESQDMFSSEEEDRVSGNIQTNRSEPVMTRTQNHEARNNETDDNADQDEIKMSPAAFTRLSKYKKMNLFDDDSDSSSDDDNFMMKSMIADNKTKTQIASLGELGKSAMKHSEDQKPEAKSHVVSQSRVSCALDEKSSNGASGADQDSNDDDKSELSKSHDSDNEERNGHISHSPTKRSETLRRSKANISPPSDGSKIKNSKKSTVNCGTKIKNYTNDDTSCKDSESEGSKTLDTRPSVACRTGKGTTENIENLKESTTADNYEDVGPVIIAETQESDSSRDESEIVYSSQAEKPTRRKINRDEPFAGESRDDHPKSEAGTTCAEKITQISDLVRKENLILAGHESTTRLDNLSDNEEIFILEVPKSVFNSSLKGKKLAFSKTTLTFGNKNYEAFQRQTAPTLSCVLKCGRKNELKTQNIRPVASIVARRKKFSLEKMDFEDSTEFQSASNNDAADETENKLSKNVIKKEKKPAKRKLPLISNNLSNSQNIEENGCGEPSSKPKKSKSTLRILSEDSKLDEEKIKPAQPESEVVEKSKKGKKPKVALLESENLPDSSHSKTQFSQNPRVDTIEKEIIVKSRSDSKPIKTKKRESHESLTDHDETKNGEMKTPKIIEEDKDICTRYSKVALRKGKNYKNSDCARSESVESLNTTVKNEKKIIKSKISLKDEETDDGISTKLAETGIPQEYDSRIDTKKYRRIKVSNDKWEVTEDANSSKRSKSKSSKILGPVNYSEFTDEKVKICDGKLKVENTMEAKSEKRKVSTLNRIDEDIIPCSIPSKKVKNSDRKIMKVESQKESDMEELLPKKQRAPRKVIPLFIKNKFKVDEKPLKSESKTVANKRKNLNRQAVNESKGTKKKLETKNQDSKPKKLKKKENFSMLKATQEIQTIIDKAFRASRESSSSSSRTSRYEPLEIQRMKKYKASSSSDEDDKKFLNRSFRMRDKSKSESDEDSPKRSTTQTEVKVNTEKPKKKLERQDPIHFDE